MRFKTLLSNLGWLLFVSCAALACLALFSPKIADGLLWRFERLEQSSKLTQRSYEARQIQHFLWLDSFPDASSAVLVGDSHLQLLAPDTKQWASNFAIGGQQVGRMIDWVPKLTRLAQAPIVFINGGGNDLAIGASVDQVTAHWKTLLERLPKTKRLVCVGTPEAQNLTPRAQQVQSLNKAIEAMCIKHGAKFIPIQIGKGEFAQHQLAIDQVHLSNAAIVQLGKLLEQIARTSPHH